MRILVTGSSGFMGRHLCLALRRLPGHEVLEFDVEHPPQRLAELAGRAEMVFHLAGVNRPQSEAEFETGNAGFTQELCSLLRARSFPPPLVLSSSIQAELDNPYGRSKKAAEDVVLRYHQETGAPVHVYRFPNVFGKWSRPNYNTVVATFCHNINRGLPVQVNNRATPLRLVYIDDIIRSFLDLLATLTSDLRPLTSGPSSLPAPGPYREVQPVHETTLGELHDLLVGFREAQAKSLLPDLSNPFVKCLYSTYLSFRDMAELARPVDLKTDDRGWLFELIKSPFAGQIFVSKTKPGITRGNHYHDTKIEKFCVIQGQGIIRFRHVLSPLPASGSSLDVERSALNVGCSPPVVPSSSLPAPSSAILEYPVSDADIRVVDIPPGYTHSIENTGSVDMITLFWANEMFDPARPDTYAMPVKE